MSNVRWKGPTNALVMQPNSPTITFADRVKAVDVYKGPVSICQQNLLPRGTFGTGFRDGWVCTQSQCTSDRGNVGTCTVEWEAGGADATQPLPAGNFSMQPQELYPKIERAGMFQPLTFDTINIVYSCLYSANSTGQPVLTPSKVPTLPSFKNAATDQTQQQQLSLALKLLAKLQKGEETFYIAGWRYTFETYSYVEPDVSNGSTIVTGNPPGPIATFPENVSWLQLADQLEPAGVAGSMYKLTSTFLGGPQLNGIGYWDPDIYVTPPPPPS